MSRILKLLKGRLHRPTPSKYHPKARFILLCIDLFPPFNHNSGMGTLRSSSGRIRIGLALTLFMLGTGIYWGFELAPYWINAYNLTDFMNEQARTGELVPDETIGDAIRKQAEDLQIPLGPGDLQVSRSSNELSITASWTKDYRFFGLYTHTFPFSRKVTAKYR